MNIEQTEIKMSLTIREAQSLRHVLALLERADYRIQNQSRPIEGMRNDCSSILHEVNRLLWVPYEH